MKARQPALIVLIAAVAFPACAFAQAGLLGQLDPFSPNASGLHITDVTISSSYYSESFPGVTGLPAGVPAGLSATMLSGSIGLGWSKSTTKSMFSVNYRPSYFRTFQSSSYRSINQSLGVTASRKLSSKLSASGSFQGLVSDFNALLFSPTLFGSLSAAPATFQELLSAMLLGQTGNSALAQLISAAPVNGSPATAFLYGGREFSASANVSLAYAQSTRSSFNLSMSAARTQFLNTGSTGTMIGPASVIPDTTMGNAALGWSYLLTPRTTVAVNVSSSRIFSRFEDEYATQITGSVGRTLTPHWFVQGMFGAGYIMPVHQTDTRYRGAQPVYGGSVGYKFKAQTLLASYTRSASDPYGLGEYANDSGTGGWAWNRPGSKNSLSASAGYSRLSQPAFPNVTSWTAQAGFSRRLQTQLVMSATYSYVRYPQRVFLQAPDIALNGVMIGLSWSPSFRRQ